MSGTRHPIRFVIEAKFFHTMKEKNAEVVPNVKPGILLMHPFYADFHKEDVFVKDSKDKTRDAVGLW